MELLQTDCVYPRFHMLAPNPHVRIFGVGHEDGALRNGISALIKETTQSAPAPPITSCEDMARRHPAINQVAGPLQTWTRPAP